MKLLTIAKRGVGVAAFAGATALAMPVGPALAADPVVIGYIGSLSSDTGLSAYRGAQIAVDELNAGGGILGGREIKLVAADTQEDVTEGIKAYEYLNEVENADFILSGSIDDVSLGWLPRMAEFRTPTLDTWTSYIGIIEMVVADYEKYKMYFMNVGNDLALGTVYIDFGRDVLARQMGWKTVVMLQEDTAFAGAVGGFVGEELNAQAGIEVVETIVYDTQTVDFAPIYNKAAALKPDFLFLISSVNSQVPSSQYVKLQVPVPMTGINVAAIGLDFWNDTGGAGGGQSTFSPLPAIGMDFDPVSQAFVDTYIARYGDDRPIFPHFNGFNAYFGLKNAVAAAERAGGFEPLDDWVREMENTDVVLEKDGQLWHRYAYWKPGEIEPRTGLEFTHNIKFDMEAPYDDGIPPMVIIQWYHDGSPRVVYPPKYANGEFQVPPWIK
ncbi:MAG: ABC transporter substrate-binding protein [Rhodobacteraceae bacterium]|nr:ABC transporter substrate-binding protein [Paracoccaceae bacterium]